METCVIAGKKSFLNDEDGSVQRAFENAANQLSKGDGKVLNTIMSFSKSQSFYNYLNEQITEKDFNKDKSIIGLSIKEEDLSGINKNVLMKIIRDYYKDRYPSIRNTVTSNDIVRRAAVAETFNIIKETYLNRLKSEVASTITLQSMIPAVTNKIYKNLLDEYADIFAKSSIAEDSVATEDLKNVALEYLNLRNKIAVIKEKGKTATKEERLNLAKERKPLEYKLELILNNLIENYNSEIDGIFREHIVNYYNLYKQARINPVEWFSNITNYKEYNELRMKFNPDEINIDENGNLKDNIEDSIDNFAKHWEEGQQSDYMSNFDTEVKIRLSMINKYITAPNGNNEGQKYTNNPLGIAETLSYRDVIIQLTDKCSYGSVRDFLNSIDELAKVIPNFYGIKKFFDDIKNNHQLYKPTQAGYIVDPNALINKIYKQLDYYKMTKEIATITESVDNATVAISQSNRNIDSLYSTVFKIHNDFQKSNLNVYSEKDKNDINSYLRIIEKKKKLTIDNINNIENIIRKYSPNIDTTFIKNIFNSNNIEEQRKLLSILSTLFIYINNNVSKYNKAKIDASKKNSGIRIQNAAAREAQMFSELKEFISVDKNDFILDSAAFKYFIELSQYAVKYNDSTNNYNSSNAEGNQASDLFKNSWLTKFFQLIEYGTDRGYEGLRRIYDNIHRQGNTQYNHSNVFYGLKDLDGKIVKDVNGNEINGLFDERGHITKDAIRQIKLIFADGVTNRSTDISSIYKNQSRLDYFITNLFTFLHARSEYVNGQEDFTINGVAKAGYFMRPPSDAPKNHIIEWYRLSIAGDENTFINSQMYHAFTGKLLGDIEDFINNLNNVIYYDKEQNKFFIKDSIKGLISKYHYNGSIVKENNGKLELTGNIFKNFKLFTISNSNNNINVNNEFIKTFNIYSKDGLFNIKKDKNNKYEVIFNEEEFININRGIRNYNDSLFSLNINENLKNFIKNSVNTWMTGFAEEANNEFSSYMKAINDKNYNISNDELLEFLFNSANMNMEFDLLFEGDSRFYENAQTFFKRTKEGVAGGENFEAYSLGDDINTNLIEITGYDGSKNISLLNGEFKSTQRINGVIKKGPITLRNGFYGVTIANTVRPSDRAKDIYEEIYNINIEKYGKENEENAKQIALELASGFGFAGNKNKTTVNDAQSYITFDEWIRRRWADGTINEYQELIDKILSIKENERLDPKLLKDINAKIQVNKNFYYDIAYDEDTHSHYPRQIKNAEFVLIPQLLPIGSSLRTVYDIMKRNDIGQLNTAETSKAGNRTIFTLFDTNTGELINNGEDFENAIKEENYRFVDTYYYRNLYKQQDVAEHSVDAKNKAGIQIMKKMIDNYHTADEPTKKAIERMIDAYAANIKNDAEAFLSSMGWKLDIDGVIKQINTSTGELESPYLVFDVFYEKAREDAKRLGLDRNFLDFLTTDEVGNPKMPNWIASSMYKRQSIAQSLINNAITRQKLPGWHAAQVTGVGYSNKLQYHPGAYYNASKNITISEESYLALPTEEERNKYVKKQAAYLEVYLPRWSNLIPKCSTEEEELELLRQMEQEGLDIHIGYRIPTEGKQSVSILKVKGFTHESLGSTIIVADEWVTQTGSDFDVDSVYGISYEMYATTKEIEGKVSISLHKIKPIYDVSEEEIIKYGYNNNDIILLNDKRAKLRYRRYITDLLRGRIRKDGLGQEIDNKTKKVSDRYLLKNNPIIKEHRDKIDAILSKNPSLANSLKKKFSEKDKYDYLSNKKMAVLVKYSKISEGDELYKSFKAIASIIANYNTIGPIRGKDSFEINEVYRAIDADIVSLEQDAKEFGLKSFDEFTKMNIIEQQSKEARNNIIVDAMVDIMNSDSSREENYSRSKFDHIIEARNKILNLWGEKAIIRSPYNPITNINNQESAMGGAQLKAVSVSWDNITSIFNKMQMMFTEGNEIIINYPYNEQLENNLRKNYTEGEDFYIPENKKFIKFIGHKLGWSNTNKNIENQIVTVYGSETTAHAVDAVKEGAIPNVNTDNFGIYKIFPMMGANYDAAMNFMLQPIISQIVITDKLKNSVYFKDNYDTVAQVLKNIAIDINTDHEGNIRQNIGFQKNNFISIIDSSSDYVVKQSLYYNKNIIEAFNKIFGLKINTEEGFDFMQYNFNIDLNILNERIKDKNINYVLDRENNIINWDKLAIDLATISIYNRLNNITNRHKFSINKAIRFSNPDKFGAKQDIKSTREVIMVVNEARDTDELLISNISGKNYVDSLYPINEETGEIDADASLYKSLATFYKHTTVPSVEINSQLFTFENSNFAKLFDDLQRAIGVKLTTKQYKTYQEYLSKYILNDIDILKLPIKLEKGRINHIDISTGELQDIIEDEILRLHGIKSIGDENIIINNVNKPTDEEIDKFNKLTPAQKVTYIKRHFIDESSIFNNILAELTHINELKIKGTSQQRVSINTENNTIDRLSEQFADIFNNSNPLIKLTAIDLVKYAMIVDGFSFGKRKLSKIIDTKSIIGSYEEGFLDMSSVFNEAPNQFINDDDKRNNFIYNYIRSHSNLLEKITLPAAKLLDSATYSALRESGVNMRELPKEFKEYNSMDKTLLEKTNKDGLITIDLNSIDKFTSIIINKLKLADERSNGKYITITRTTTRPKNNKSAATRDNVLYQIILDNNIAYLIPINKLEENEVMDISLNNNNNKFKVKEYYLATTNIEYRDGLNEEELKQLLESNVPQIKNEIQTYTNKEIEPRLLYIASKNGDSSEKSMASKIISDIEESLKIISNDRDRIIYEPTYYLASIVNPGESIIQEIEIDGEAKIVEIKRINPKQSRGFIRTMSNALKNINSEALYSYKFAAKQLNDTLGRNVPRDINIVKANANNFYVISPVERTVVRESSSINLEDSENPVSKSIALIRTEVNYQSAILKNQAAERFISKIKGENINLRSNQSIIDNYREIYKEAAKYYRKRKEEIDFKLNNFILTPENSYQVNEKELYERLAEHPEKFHELSKLLLEAKTFKNRLEDLYNLNFGTEDAELNSYIDDIKRSIDYIVNHPTLHDAFKNIFDIYFAKNYSTNPFIREGLLTLREQFGDTDNLDAWFSDTAELNNNQVQTILKAVYHVMDTASMITIPKMQKIYDEELARIESLPGEINYSNVVNDYGELYTEHNSQFVEDWESKKTAVYQAYQNGRYTLDYYKKLLDKNKFEEKYTIQRYKSEYYNDKNTILENVLNEIGEDFVKYMELRDNIYALKKKGDAITKDEIKELESLQSKLKYYTYKPSVDMVTDEFTANKYAKRLKIYNAINEYKKASKAISAKYFKNIEDESFRETLQYNLDYIKSYDIEHPTMSLEDKLENEKYSKSYKWLRDNANASFTDKAREEISKAFAVLKGDKSNGTNTALSIAKEIEGGIDRYGRINPLTFSEEDIIELKEEAIERLYSKYDNDEGDIMLIKNVPSIPIMKGTKTSDKKVSEEKLKLIREMNEILSKAVNKDGNYIDVRLFFDDNYVTNEEREKLANLMYDYRNQFPNIRNLAKAKSVKKKYDYIVNKDGKGGFTEAYDYYNTTLKSNSIKAKQFIRIFQEFDGIDRHPNSNIFGYLMPKDELIDKDKTAAKEYINKNIEFVPTEYYYKAKQEVLKQGLESYNKWFQNNHIYNPYSRTFEPLSIWTEIKPKVGGDLDNVDNYNYNPINGNSHREILPEYDNTEEYNSIGGLKYNRIGDANNKYANPITLNNKERELLNLYKRVLRDGSVNNSITNFVGKGYAPRQFKQNIDKYFIGKEALKATGMWITRHDGADGFDHENIGFEFDSDVKSNMATLLKAKGWQSKPNRNDFNTDEEYYNTVKEVTKHNRELEKQIIDKNWNKVFRNFIEDSQLVKAKESIKDYLYLLAEDLKQNKAYATSGILRKKVKASARNSYDDKTFYNKIDQTDTIDLIKNFARRIIYDEYHAKSNARDIANTLQSVASAKFMILNLHGGIANVGTGLANMSMEAFADEYFGNKEFFDSIKTYIGPYGKNIFDYVMESFTQNARISKQAAMIRFFNVVNYEELNRRGDESLADHAERIRNYMYFMLSGGEHFMQNCAMFAMAKSHKVYKDNSGKIKIGSFKNYLNDIENEAMEKTLEHDENLYNFYKSTRNSFKNDKQTVLELTTLRKDPIRMFMNIFKTRYSDKYKEIWKKYNENKQELIKNAKERFNSNEFTSIEDILSVNDTGNIIINNDKGFTDEQLKEIEKQLVFFKRKVISINNKIHGVYNKLGAASIERKFYGSLVMQYHKHLYPGILKAWRYNGYYNEFRETKERGYYQDLIKFLTLDFENYDNYKSQLDKGQIGALLNIQTSLKCLLGCMHLKENWSHLSEYEKSNIKRVSGTAAGMLVPAILAMLIYAGFDDDDEKNNLFASNALYICDRLINEAYMYTPGGLVTEKDTLWSSPIAANTGPNDYLKIANLLVAPLFDPDFSYTYKTGLYRGRNKVAVLLRRQVPILRGYDRIMMSTRNNNYYKIGDKSHILKFAKLAGNSID